MLYQFAGLAAEDHLRKQRTPLKPAEADEGHVRKRAIAEQLPCAIDDLRAGGFALDTFETEYQRDALLSPRAKKRNMIEEQCYAEAEELLTKHWTTVDSVAKKLLGGRDLMETELQSFVSSSCSTSASRICGSALPDTNCCFPV